ncbi:MAG: hypothetical protein NVS1B13_08620 [Flavisolibacter sp.]
MKFKKFLHILFFALTLSSFISCSSSRRFKGIGYGWELLGSQRVDFIRDKDEIIVNGTTRYTAVRFHVADRDVLISGLKIILQNGDKLEPAIEERVGAGQDSRVIQLDREGRLINKIEFTYRTVGSILKGRAKLLVYGKRSGYESRY